MPHPARARRASSGAVRLNDHAALEAALTEIPVEADKPTCVIAHTVKGKGVSFMENTVLWHYRTAKGDELEAALRELEGQP